MTIIQLVFKPHQDAEKKHSRRFVCVSGRDDKGNVLGKDDFPLSDIYLKRPFSNDAKEVHLSIEV
jgi:hypothetical protein